MPWWIVVTASSAHRTYNDVTQSYYRNSLQICLPDQRSWYYSTGTYPISGLRYLPDQQSQVLTRSAVSGTYPISSTYWAVQVLTRSAKLHPTLLTRSAVHIGGDSGTSNDFKYFVTCLSRTPGPVIWIKWVPEWWFSGTGLNFNTNRQ